MYGRVGLDRSEEVWIGEYRKRWKREKNKGSRDERIGETLVTTGIVSAASGICVVGGPSTLIRLVQILVSSSNSWTRLAPPLLDQNTVSKVHLPVAPELRRYEVIGICGSNPKVCSEIVNCKGRGSWHECMCIYDQESLMMTQIGGFTAKQGYSKGTPSQIPSFLV